MPSTYTLISSNVLTSSAASVTFSAIPSTYTDLVLRISARGNNASVTNYTNVTFNGDTSSIYSEIVIAGNGSTVSSPGLSGMSYTGWDAFITGANATSDTFGSVEFYIPSYLASQNKPLSYIASQENNNTQAYTAAAASLYRSTTAISSLTITAGSGSFVSGSSFYLYGIKSS